jgi:hypothetical protein
MEAAEKAASWARGARRARPRATRDWGHPRRATAEHENHFLQWLVDSQKRRADQGLLKVVFNNGHAADHYLIEHRFE